MVTLSVDEGRQRFAAARVARMATITPEGAPHIVPVTFAVADGTIYSIIDTKPKTTSAVARLRNIRATPTISMLVDQYSDDWTRLWWVRADGKAEVTEAGDILKHATELLGAKYAQYYEPTREKAFGPTIVVRVSRWTAWSYA